MTTRRLPIATVVAALGLTLLATPSAATPPTPPEPPTLVGVKAKHVGDVDRVTFTFRNGVPDQVFARWVDRMAYDGSGLPVRVAGARVLAVGFTSATAHDDDGVTIGRRKAFALPNVITSVFAGDFEGYVSVGLGVQKQTSYTIRELSNPARVVVDVAAGFPTTTRKVWLVDTDAVENGDGPVFVPRSRPLRTDAPAGAALHALFAGPTRQERRAGLALVRSRAWGFDDLAIADRIARLRLTRGCGSGGSTVTIAGQVMPTLRQFPTVDWVKISAPGGATEQPDGPSDSIPACLEP